MTSRCVLLLAERERERGSEKTRYTEVKEKEGYVRRSSCYRVKSVQCCTFSAVTGREKAVWLDIQGGGEVKQTGRSSLTMLLCC